MGVLEADAANSEGRKINGYGTDYDNSVVRDVGQLTVVPAIAWKRRANQQEIHQLSVKPLSVIVSTSIHVPAPVLVLL